MRGAKIASVWGISISKSAWSDFKQSSTICSAEITDFQHNLNWNVLALGNLDQLPDVLHLFVGQRSPQPTQSLSVLQDCTQPTAKPWQRGTNTKWNCLCSNGPGQNSTAFKKHQFRAINDVCKTPSKLGSTECNLAEELRSSSGVRC